MGWPFLSRIACYGIEATLILALALMCLLCYGILVPFIRKRKSVNWKGITAFRHKWMAFGVERRKWYGASMKRVEWWKRQVTFSSHCPFHNLQSNRIQTIGDYDQKRMKSRLVHSWFGYHNSITENVYCDVLCPILKRGSGMRIWKEEKHLLQYLSK